MPHIHASHAIGDFSHLQQTAFLEPDGNSLSPPKKIDPEKWATHLAHISAQEPSNLLNHVRRIYLHFALDQVNPLFGAMLDLYLALGNKGERLRHRLLNMTNTLLPQEMQDLFITHQRSGLQFNQPLPPNQYSVLGNFFSGGMRLVTQQNAETQAPSREHDPLELARDELNYGDITVAQQILEEALLQTPQRLGLHYGLLEIYKHTQSLNDLIAMRGRLGDDVTIAEAAWNQMQKSLEVKAS
jgi:hypothetical protein